MAKTAVLVDGGFYRKRARSLWGKKSPDERADELNRYVFEHLSKKDGPSERELYRVFYYDCPPLKKTVYHPLLRRNIDFGKLESYKWTNDFFDELKTKRKFALRMGRLSDNGSCYILHSDKLKKICAGTIKVDDLTETDFQISFKQKGVDMKLGIDVASLADDGIVDQIILIAGDSDFVPAAKYARRHGIDFILDPMGISINDDLLEHIDGLESFLKHDPCANRSADDGGRP